jgi:hypothetical protein
VLGGAWRNAPVLAGTADVGMRGSVGGAHGGFTGGLYYTPGYDRRRRVAGDGARRRQYASHPGRLRGSGALT